jgi:tripartite motif-containing protein 71
MTNNCIHVFTPDAQYIRSWGSTGSDIGQFISPADIAINQSNFMYVIDSGNNRVQIFSFNGTHIGQWGLEKINSSRFEPNRAIAFDKSGNVIMTDARNNRVQIFDPSGKLMDEFGSVGSEFGQFNVPRGVAVNSLGDVFISDSTNNRIQKFSPKIPSGQLNKKPIPYLTLVKPTITTSDLNEMEQQVPVNSDKQSIIDQILTFIKRLFD